MASFAMIDLDCFSLVRLSGSFARKKEALFHTKLTCSIVPMKVLAHGDPVGHGDRRYALIFPSLIYLFFNDSKLGKDDEHAATTTR